MHVSIPLAEMTVEEKIQAMESIWTDLCQRAESVASPSWHEDVLTARGSADDESVEDWDSAKKKINKSIRED